MSLQGTLLGQHNEMLHSLVESNTALLKQVSELTSSLSVLSARLASVASSPVATTASQPIAGAATSIVVREPSVPVPKRYSGDTGACQSFLVWCSLVFELQPHSYVSEGSRIAYGVSLLTGWAREWGAVIWSSRPELSRIPHSQMR